MTRPRSDVPDGGRRYGLGFWLHATTDSVILSGYDAGVSFSSLARPARGRHRDGDLELVRRRLARRADSSSSDSASPRHTRRPRLRAILHRR